MPHTHERRRQEIKARLEHAEKSLCAARNSAGGHSRAIRLHLEREIHASKKDLALLELQVLQLTIVGNPCESPDRKQ